MHGTLTETIIFHFFSLPFLSAVKISCTSHQTKCNTSLQNNSEIPGAVSAPVEHGCPFEISVLLLISTMDLIYSQSSERIISPRHWQSEPHIDQFMILWNGIWSWLLCIGQLPGSEITYILMDMFATALNVYVKQWQILDASPHDTSMTADST